MKQKTFWNRVFPEMYERVDKGDQVKIWLYWISCFVLVPQYMPLLLMGLWDNLTVSSWAECILFTLNAVVMFAMLREPLADSFYMLRLDIRTILKTVGLAWLLMIPFWFLAFEICNILTAMPLYALDIFPVTETTVTITAGYLIENLPVVGTLCVTLIVPFGVCGLFYASSFAPFCCHKRWLGYLTVAVALLVPTLADILWRGDASYNMAAYLARLPVHLLACWTYQKTDNMWSPILCLGGWNLLTALAYLALNGMPGIWG